jgi:hypothetical protein
MKGDRRILLGPELPRSMAPLLRAAEACLERAVGFLREGQDLAFVVLYRLPGDRQETEMLAWSDEEDKACQRETMKERALQEGALALLLISDCFYLDPAAEAADPSHRPSESERRKEQVVVEIYTPTHNASWTWSYKRRPEQARPADRILLGEKRLISVAKGGSPWDPWPRKPDA